MLVLGLVLGMLYTDHSSVWFGVAEKSRFSCVKKILKLSTAIHNVMDKTYVDIICTLESSFAQCSSLEDSKLLIVLAIDFNWMIVVL